ncbi:phytoene desaturase family protein [Polyangium jinanense]|uniref:Pyridine nucleotide-disulfide oxidoreductase domain-containing protein 2 n=1 Tax=Polyangium jinanense TaxID=2829994 RepID=A0A9X3XJN7_9BACT|nr:NAD(P)/FAD-dependent oxidoreductase [Polyangium jinanense]MDC3962404.1 NAD(P)/FAD-dependent oxidoreductase [Polyangium jinanense]MDC3989296.1 NAD(P)/FAD-dependent oxidoreductase [Polyangium jinanense]
MRDTHDVVIIGGGHNGLVMGAYLAKAGLDVCIVEKNAWLGGGCVTQEVCGDGYKSDLAAICHIFIQANPLLRNDELGLKSRYGLKYTYPDAPYAVVFPDDRAYVCHRDVERTCAMIEERFSPRDADAYLKFYQWAAAGLELLLPTMYSPGPSTGELFSALGATARGQDVMRALMMSSLQLLDDWFVNDPVKIAMARFTTEVIAAPQDVGTGMLLYMMVPFIHRFGIGIPVGGSGALTQSLQQCLVDHGATIHTSAGVSRIEVIGGEARGVVLDSGARLGARKAVVSAVNVKQLFQRMLASDNLPDELSVKAGRLKVSSFQTFLQSLALNEAPRYKAGADVDRACCVEFAADTMAEFRQHFDAFSYGHLRSDGPLMITPSLFDPTRAPPGKHVGYLLHYAPYHLAQGASQWDHIGESFADELIAHLRRRTSNMADESIIARSVMTPLGFERWNTSFIEGEANHIGNYIFQSMGMRPMPGYGHHRTPVSRLYMTGASTHPGGGLTAGSGRAAAMVLMRDLGMSTEAIFTGS